MVVAPGAAVRPKFTALLTPAAEYVPVFALQRLQLSVGETVVTEHV
jgi:hypothetical protein